MANFLTLTIVFLGKSLNYNENVANISVLKRFSFRGKSFSYISRQALRYDIVRIMHEEFGMSLTDVGISDRVVQFKAEATIKDFPEIDLFGYMKTSGKGSKGKTRKGVVRLTDGVSLESWNGDIDFGNNMGLALRREKEGEDFDNVIISTEKHKSFYTYTLTVDLDKVGIDENDNIFLPNEERKRRVDMLLDAISILYRDVKGSRENLSPCFVIGGIYPYGNPFFYNMIMLEFTKYYEKGLAKLVVETINDILNKEIGNLKVKDYTYVGSILGIFSNIHEIDLPDDRKVSVNEFFKKIKKELEVVYA